jgi:hypothetical protein
LFYEKRLLEKYLLALGLDVAMGSAGNEFFR